jgi:outer membrane protein TolC
MSLHCGTCRDCLTRVCCYFGAVPDLPFLRQAGVFALGLALASAGCAPSREGLASFRANPGAAEGLPNAAVAEPPLWWETAGDATLASVIRRGLAANPELICAVVSLRAKDQEAEAAARRLGNRIARLFDTGASSAEQAAAMARAYRYADRRARLAADIAAAYIELRSLQEIRVLRAELHDQFKDNAEIAAFRREAGLVSGLDSGLAGSLVSVASSDLDALDDRIDAAVRELARLSGAEPDEIRAELGDDGRVPDIAVDVSGQTRLSLHHRADLLALESNLLADMTRNKVTQEDLDAVLAGEGAGEGESPATSPAAIAVARYREAQAQAYDDLRQRREAVANAAARQAELEKAVREARATVKNARLAYRNGTGAFTTLYVAESAALATHEARIRARAALATATIRLWTAEGGGWTARDLGTPPTDIGVTPEVTVCE